MPVRGEKRGTRDRPASITTRTPSMVRLVSAIDVESTIFRRPDGIGADGAILRVVRQRAIQRDDDGIAKISLVEQRLDAADLARAREKDENVAAVVSQRRSDRAGDGAPRRAARSAARRIAFRPETNAPSLVMNWRVAEQRGDRLPSSVADIDDDAEVVARATACAA